MKVKTVSFKKLSRPWITESLTKEINFKHMLFKRFKEGVVDFVTYNNYKNVLTKKIEKRKVYIL